MPNKIKGYKRSVATTGRMHVSRSRKGASVKALLERFSGPGLERIADQADAQARWREWLARHLPEGLAAHVSGVAQQGERLTVFTESAAWSARARFAMAELEGLIKKERPEITEVRVKVMPRK